MQDAGRTEGRGGWTCILNPVSLRRRGGETGVPMTERLQLPLRYYDLQRSRHHLEASHRRLEGHRITIEVRRHGF